MQTLPLAVLPRADSVALLQQLASRLIAEEAAQIAEALGDLPLAPHLSGCYLARYHLSVADYLARLASVQLKHQALQGKAVERLPTEGTPNVERAFALSLVRLDASNPIDDLARKLLARAACFAPEEPFGQWWLEATITPEGDEEDQQLASTDAIERLLGLGLLERVSEGVVRLHRLLGAYAALALSLDDALPAVERVVGWVAYEANETKVPQTMLPVLPHLRHLEQQAQGREDDLAATLYTNLGFYLGTVGAYDEARLLLEQALVIRELVLGDDHPLRALSLNNLARVLEIQGAYEEARPLFERALAICERVLGPDHPQTAASLNNLAHLLKAQGEVGEAGLLYDRSRTICEKMLGPDHPQTAISLNNLAAVYRAQRLFEKAHPLYERALAICELVLGPAHPSTAMGLSNLAMSHSDHGEFTTALPLIERAVAIWQVRGRAPTSPPPSRRSGPASATPPCPPRALTRPTPHWSSASWRCWRRARGREGASSAAQEGRRASTPRRSHRAQAEGRSAATRRGRQLQPREAQPRRGRGCFALRRGSLRRGWAAWPSRVAEDRAVTGSGYVELTGYAPKP